MGKYLMHSGPPIWLVLALGALALVAALRYVTNRQEKQYQLALGAAIASVIAGLLGTILGFQKSVGGLHQVTADDRWIYLVGLKESLNNLVVALLFAAIVSLLLMAGRYRQSSLGEAQ